MEVNRQYPCYFVTAYTDTYTHSNSYARIHSYAYTHTLLHIYYTLIYIYLGKHVVFGKVLEGMDVVTHIEEQGSPSGTPYKKVIIIKSGELEV